MNILPNDIYQRPNRVSQGEIVPDSLFKQVVRERSQSGHREHVKRCTIRILSYQGQELPAISTHQHQPLVEDCPKKRMLPRISSIESNTTACSESALPSTPHFAPFTSCERKVAP